MDSAGEIESLSEFVATLASGGFALGDPPVWYRGQSDADYPLVPSVFRAPREGTNETLLLKRFMQDARSLLSEMPIDDWHWLFLSQHHGVPTRLLDWSEGPLIGLYFACEAVAADEQDPEQPGALWVLNPQGVNDKALNDGGKELPLFGLDKRLDRYHPLHTEPEFAILPPVAGLAVRNFLRISAQWGTFTAHMNASPLEDLAPQLVRKYLVPADAKANIREELRALGIHERTVFPDLHHLGMSIRSSY